MRVLPGQLSVGVHAGLHRAHTRDGRVNDAMQFAQTVLASLKPSAAHRDAQLRVRAGLLALCGSRAVK